MDVQLTSPKSEDVVALGTVMGDRGDYLDVTINMIMNSSTRLPQAKGSIKLLGHAQAHTVAWPRQYVSAITTVAYYYLCNYLVQAN